METNSWFTVAKKVKMPLYCTTATYIHVCLYIIKYYGFEEWGDMFADLEEIKAGSEHADTIATCVHVYKNLALSFVESVQTCTSPTHQPTLHGDGVN